MDDQEENEMEPQQGGADAAAGGARGGGRGGEGDQTAFILMEEVLERLKLLNYEATFFPKGFRPLTRVFFAMPSANSAEQFHYFTTLATWLMNKLGNDARPPSHYDDPNSTVANLTMELQKLGVPSDFPPMKVKAGHGDAVCSILLSLLVKIGHEWRKPFHPPDETVDEAHVDDSAALDADGGGVADDVGHGTEDEDELYYGGAGGAAAQEEASKPPQTAIEPSVEPEAWKLELERVLPQLRLQVAADGKEWRTHIAAAKGHQRAAEAVLPASTSALEQISAELSQTIEAVGKVEARLNAQCEADISEYAGRQADFAAKQEVYSKSTEQINRLQNQLASVTDELQAVKGRMDERGAAMSDTSPVVKIKNALAKLKAETRAMEVRIGVVSHSLLLKRLGANAAARTALQPSILAG